MATNNGLNYKPTQYYVQAGSTNGNIQDLASLGSAADALTSAGAGALPAFAAFGSDYIFTQFTSSGTWTKDSRTKVVEVLIWGGGSGGGSGRRGTSGSSSGGGGGSGAGSLHMVVPVDFF